ncbi:MAG: TIGR00268 family protein [Planctomycetota bacterium]|nr:MAG: TIGR00268 family protein [Planctomycetota bacterium]
MSEGYRERCLQLHRILDEMPGALVAFSGGVDSTALLAAARERLGPEKVIAVTADGPAYPAHERQESVEIAEAFGVSQRILGTDELGREGYRRNAEDRCYFCKTELFTEIAAVIRAQDLPPWPLLYGAIADDLGDHRPGLQAATEHGVRAPLAECGFSKDEVRRYSRELGLPTADKPSFACLSSRVAYGIEIDQALLSRIEAAEELLRSRGFRQFRVRHHGTIARIELEEQELLRACEDPLRGEILQRLKGLGWSWVCLDLSGFRSGSMNAEL